MSTGKEIKSGNICDGPVVSQQATINEHLSADLKRANKLQQQQLSNDNSTKTTTTLLVNDTSDNVDSNHSTPNHSQQNSPTKSTPSKSSRNKRKNDAKKRNANLKKQQKQADTGQVNADASRNNTQDKKKQPQTMSNLHSPSNDSQNLEPSITVDEHVTSHCDTDSTKPSRPMHGNTPKDNDDIALESQCQSEETQRDTELEPPGTKNNGQTSNNNGYHQGRSPNKVSIDSNTWNRKQRENRELKELIKLKNAQLQSFANRINQQINKIKELETSLINVTRACNQLEKLVQQEASNRNRLENENENLNQNILRLKSSINAYDKEKAANNELIRTLNATLMERETEVSILKLKLTRMQTSNPPTLNNAASSLSVGRQIDPAKAYTASGRSNSEFSRGSYARSSMLAETAASTRSSTSQLQQHNNEDALIWAKVPQELTPSKRPILLDRNFATTTIHGDSRYSALYDPVSLSEGQQSSTPISRDSRRYKTLPRSMKSPELPTPHQVSSNNFIENHEKSAINETQPNINNQKQPSCLITNLDESNSTNQSSAGNKTNELNAEPSETTKSASNTHKISSETTVHASQITSDTDKNFAQHSQNIRASATIDNQPLPSKSPSTPVKFSSGIKKIFNVFRRSDSSIDSEVSQSKSDICVPPIEVPSTPTAGPFQRGSTRSTLVGIPGNARGAHVSRRDFHTDKPFAEWDTDMLVDWLTTIGLSMYANQCRRWVKCGAYIMDATPAEVDKGLGITNHLHRKKLRLAISELNGDCDKITKAAAKLDYLWVARWLDDIGLPQYKEAFINGRVDGRMLNYLTVEDLFSLGVKSVLHHSSIKCGIRVLRSINFDLQALKRRATANEVEQMNSIRQKMNADELTHGAAITASDQGQVISEPSDVPLWTCHRVMEWLRMIDFAEFAPNLRGSGVHGGLLVYEDGFYIDSISSLLGIPSSRTLLRRHLATFFDNLLGPELIERKRQCKTEPIKPGNNFKMPKKSPIWLKVVKGPKVGQDGADDYLCPMYPVEPQIIKSPTKHGGLASHGWPIKY